jgi:prenylcysteine oxidase/farnesylcysteine lyase
MVCLAIIGAGIGGCSAAYYIRRYFPRAQITLYDKATRIGGRIFTARASASGTDELGAVFFTPLNKTVCELVQELGFSLKLQRDTQNLAIWNGTEFIYKSRQSAVSQMLKLLFSYKLSVLKLRAVIQNAQRQLVTLYEEEQRRPTEIQKLFESSGLDTWYTQSFDKILIQSGLSRALINEIVTPITRVIYSQNAQLGGLAGISSLLGVYKEKTYTLDGGNSVLPHSLVAASGSTLKLDSKVISIEKTSDDTYRVSTGTQESKYHGVFIAAPLEISQIQIDGVSPPEWISQGYQRVHIQVMKGTINPRYFNLNDPTVIPSLILTTTEADPITHFNIHLVSPRGAWVTVSSTKPLPNDFLNEILIQGRLIQDHTWNAAYPIFKPIETVPPTQLDKGLMYINAIESAVSSLESSTFAAFNAVQMFKKDSNVGC